MTDNSDTNEKFTAAYLDRDKPRRRLPWGNIAVFAALGAAVGSAFSQKVLEIVEARPSEIERKLDAVADELVGNNVDVECKYLGTSSGESEGDYVRILGGYGTDHTQNRGVIFLDESLCQGISHAIEHPTFDPPEVSTDLEILGAFGIFSFGHEIGHAEGIINEGEANCRGVELYPVVADALGIESYIADIDALRLAQSMRQTSEYHAGGC